MNKKDLNDLLFAYVCGALSEEEVRQVRDRCATDPAYAEELALTRAALRVLTYRKPQTPQPFFWTRLSARLDRKDAPWQAWIWVAKRLIPALVVATLLVTTLAWYQTPSQEMSSLEASLPAAGDTEEEAWLTQSQTISKETVLQAVLDAGVRRK